MPNKFTRNSSLSGMKKYSDGGVPSQGVPANANSTYPDLTGKPTNQISLVDNVPVNITYAEKLPSSPTPLGGVDLGPVNMLGGKK